MNNHLAAILGEKLITISEVATHTGIARSTLTAMYYRRSKGITYDTAKRLCDFLQVPLHELLDYVPEPQHKP